MTLVIVGCSTVKTPCPIGGSRSDGVVNLTYSYNEFEKPVIDWDKAYTKAKERCISWGYVDAQPFGAKSKRFFYGLFATRYVVTIPYQCIGSPK